MGAEVLVWFALLLAFLLLSVAAWAARETFRDGRLRIRRTLSPAQLQVARPSWATLELSDDLPPLSQISDAVPPEVDGGGTPTRRRIVPVRRGYLSLGPLTLHRRDPFGLARWSRSLAGGAETLVWPRTDAVPSEIFSRLHSLAMGRSGPPTPEIDDLTLREYRHGDPLSRVHWKRTAQHGSLMVRHDEPARSTHIDLVLLGSEKVEPAIDVLAAAALNLDTPESTLRLLTARDEVAGDLAAILTALALTNGGVTPPSTPGRGIVVVALATPRPAALRELVTWASAGALDPAGVFVFSPVALSSEARQVLKRFTVVQL